MTNENAPADDVVIDDEKGSPIEENLKSKSTWLRGLFMCIYLALIWLASMIGLFVVVVGFFWVLFTGEKNTQLQQVGQSIAGYIYEVVRYLTFNSDAKPFPFGESWPSGNADEAA